MNSPSCHARPCPICAGAATGVAFPYRTDWNNKRFNYLACGTCGATFVDPTPDDADFAQMYSKANYHDEHYSDVAVEHYRRSIRLLKSLVGGEISLLDFGCGNGSFLAAGRLEGLSCAGVELDADTIGFAAQNSGCPVSTLDEMKASGRRFDSVHLGDVLEHLPDPAAFLRQLEPLLNPGGLFFIEGPLENNPSAVFACARLFAHISALMGRTKRGQHPPTHLFRVDSANQRAFFTDRMNYTERYCAVHETGWPYYNKGEPFRLAPGFLIKFAIGLFALALSGFPAPGRKKFGNRFTGLYALKEQAS